MKPAVQLHADQGDYVRYVLTPSGERAQMTYRERKSGILDENSFPDKNHLEWRLQSGSAAPNSDKITLTVHDGQGKALSDYLFIGNAGDDEPYTLTVFFVTASSYELTVERRNGKDELVEALGNGVLQAPSNESRQHILFVFLEQ